MQGYEKNWRKTNWRGAKPIKSKRPSNPLVAFGKEVSLLYYNVQNNMGIVTKILAASLIPITLNCILLHYVAKLEDLAMGCC